MGVEWMKEDLQNVDDVTWVDDVDGTVIPS